MGKSIYKSADTKNSIRKFYQNKRTALDFPYQEMDVETNYGRTRVIKTGNENGKRIVLFHGIHAGAPLTLETVKPLREQYLLIAIDTPGQATMSAETRMNPKDDSFAKWANEVLTKLSVSEATCIGISYGGFILQKLITHYPERVEKCIFVVPAGLANGAFWASLKKLTLPLLRFHLTKKDEDLRAFTSHFIPDDDRYMFEFQRAILLGLHMDYRRPGILTRKEVAHVEQPIYLMVADNDVFFPGDKTLQRARQVFNNVRETHVLNQCKHIPHPSHFAEINDKLKNWID